MKISKALLNTIVIAVTAGTVTSCSKSVEAKTAKQAEIKKQQSEVDSTQYQGTPYSCPACGMG